MSTNQIKKTARILKALTQNKMLSYEPYAKQKEFHNLGKTKRERLLLAGNQSGKCATLNTFIDLPDGSRKTIGELFESGEQFEVYAYKDGEVIKAMAGPVFKKDDPAECYRVMMSDGRWFECADRHRILTSEGYVLFEELLKFSPELQECTDERDFQSAHASSVHRSFGTLGDSRDRYSLGRRLCGELLPSGPAGDREPLPSQAGAQRRALRESCNSDGQARRSKHSLWGQCSDLLSNLGDQIQSAARSFAFAPPTPCTDGAPYPQSSRTAWRPPIASASQLRSHDAGQSRSSESSQACLSPLSVSGNKIVHIKPIGVHDVYDFTVPGPHNYVLAGLVHHNTYSAAMEVAFHCTGRYPDWWEGRRFDGPVRFWVAGTSAEGTRDTVQRLLLGEGTNYGTGAIPKNAISEIKMARTIANAVAQVFIKHNSGGESYIGFKSYEQQLDRWAGESLNGIWCDEEPPAKHYTEGLTRLNARNGIMLMTLTPLLGMTKTVKMFYPHPTTMDRSLTMMTLDDVGHYTENEKETILASYPPHEREARMRGIPMRGSGRVFPVTIESVSVKPFEIPDHWPLLGGIDFGWDHPTGCVATAWDRDSDCIYVTHAYRAREQTPSQMSVEIREWNKGMPWAWPHDGNRIGDRDSQQTEAELYRRQGVRMLREHATFDDGGHGFEAGLMEMLERMNSGRLKVFHHLEAWFNEFDAYHRKDGRVVKEDDDLMSATRMCVMAKRMARTAEPMNKFPRMTGLDYDPLSQGVV